jgi:hypothetical protein
MTASSSAETRSGVPDPCPRTPPIMGKYIPQTGAFGQGFFSDQIGSFSLADLPGQNAGELTVLSAIFGSRRWH